MGNFYEATVRTSSEKDPTVTHVLPLTLGLINGLLEVFGTLPYANALINALLESMYERFNGLLQLVQYTTSKVQLSLCRNLQMG